VRSATLPALVLAAGLGTRLRPLTYLRAKAATPVAGRPLIARVIDRLAALGLSDLVVNLHHLPATIAAIVGDGSPWNLRVRYSWEQPVLGSAGGPRHALPLLDADPFFILNADTLTTVDLAGLRAAHEAWGARVTLAVIPNPAPARYGGVVVGDDGRVEGFTRAGDPRPAYHFVGVQVAAHATFAALPDGVPAESVTSVYRRLVAEQPGAVRAWVCDAEFHDIGTPRECLDTSLTLAARECAGSVPYGPGTTVNGAARLRRTVLWNDVRIGSGCDLEGCIVGDGADVPAGFSRRDAVIVPAASCPAEAAGERVGNLLVVPMG
jgi:NDP-sugar pyrophosphorylase family protein